MARKKPSRPIEDPILQLVKPGEEPPRGMLRKRTSQGMAASGTPPAGRTTIEDARRRGLIGWLQLLGPGLITGASDDDPSGIGTYSQVGSQFGYGLLWTALFTFPLMAAVQELCGRIALHTGMGLAVSLRRKFPTWLIAVAVLGLLGANIFNLGADLGAVAAGGALLSRGLLQPMWLLIPIAVLLVALQIFVTYAVIFKIFKWLTVALFAYVITVFFAHPQALTVLRATVVPHVELSRGFVTALVAVLGTTISPYLFFWQASSEVEELAAADAPRQRRRQVEASEMRAARTDIIIGMAFSQVVMYFIVLTSAAVLHAHGKTDIATAQQAAAALEPLAGPFAFAIFALGIIGAGLLAIPILGASATYALKDFIGLRGSLRTRFRYRPTFYVILAAATVGGLVMNFVHLDPIRALFITAVINGVLAPPLLVLIVLLGRDRSVMRTHTSGWMSLTLTWIATIFMAVAAVVMIATMVIH